MSRVTGKPPTHWRRPMTRTYDYNMSLGENYYKPQLDYIESRKGRGKTPPSATTFAERLLQFPPSRRSASATRRAEESSSATGQSSYSSAASAAEASLARYASLDDLGLDDDFAIRRRRQLIDASLENLADRGTSPMLSPAVGNGGRHRVTFGDSVLDAAGVKEVDGSFQSGKTLTSSLSKSHKQTATSSSSLMTSDEGDAIDKILAERRNRRQQGLLAIQSADADLYTEDPLKSPKMSSRLLQARRELDEMRDEMKKDSESSSVSSRFRQKLRAKREREAREEMQQQQHDNFFGGSLSALNEIGSSTSASSAASKARQFLSESSSSSSAAAANSGRSSSSQQIKISNISSSAQNLFQDDDDSETAALLSKVAQIRKNAKARLAQITDEDFPDLQIGSSLASRRAAGRRLDDDFDSGDFRLQNNNSAASSTGGRSVTISKRTVRSSYDVE